MPTPPPPRWPTAASSPAWRKSASAAPSTGPASPRPRSASAGADGRFRAGVEEERFRGVKRWAGFPEQALRFCLDELGGDIGDVAALAVSRQPRAYFLRKALLALSHPRRPRRAPGPGAPPR